MTIAAALSGALFFAIVGYIGILTGRAFASGLKPLDDGPKPHDPPLVAIIAGCVFVGALVCSQPVSSGQVLFAAVLCGLLAAIWCVDVQTGVIPDALTLVPLALIAIVALWRHEWGVLLAASIPLLPFAIAAFASRGRGMGWGDVKLAALGGAILGAQTAVLMFALACLAAVAVAYLSKQRAKPIAFGPYMAGAIALALPLISLR